VARTRRAAAGERRRPGRALRRATTPEGLREAWAALEGAWASALDRVTALPAGSVDVSVAGEWSFVQTLRHLVLATDMWLGKGVLRLEQPFHPLGLKDRSMDDEEGVDDSVFATGTPSYDDVLAARADRVAMVRDFLATVSPEQLSEQRPNPHDPEYPETVLNCLHVVLEESWEHLRFALRDLDTIEGS
jgi:hypothetical protein